MPPTRCAYCRDLVKLPRTLHWVIRRKSGKRPISGSMPLCTACSRSWCVPELAGSARQIAKIRWAG